MDAFGYDVSDFVPSELPPHGKGVDIHHVDSRKMGGQDKDRIENLMALTRKEHVRFGDYKQHRKMLYVAHRTFMDAYGVKYDAKYMQELIDRA